MARHHRHAVHTAPTAPLHAPGDGPEPEEVATPPTPLGPGWRVAMLVWALGFGALLLYELAGFVVRAVRAAGR